MHVVIETHWQTAVDIPRGREYLSNWFDDEEGARKVQMHYADRGIRCRLRSRTQITITSDWKDEK